MTWWNSSWAKRCQVIVKNIGSAQTDYPIKFTITKFLGMAADCKDIRVIDEDDSTQLKHWVEIYDANNVLIWVKVPSLPSRHRKLYVYFDNSAASNVADPANVFSFFDHFPGTSLDLTKWDKSATGTITVANSEVTITAGAIINAWIKTISTFSGSLNIRWRLHAGLPSTGDQSCMWGFWDTGYTAFRNVYVSGGKRRACQSNGTTEEYIDAPDTTNYLIEMIRWQDGANSKYYSKSDAVVGNDTLIGTLSTYKPTSPFKARMEVTWQTIVCDWVAIFKAAEPEPIVYVAPDFESSSQGYLLLPPIKDAFYVESGTGSSGTGTELELGEGANSGNVNRNIVLEYATRDNLPAEGIEIVDAFVKLFRMTSTPSSGLITEPIVIYDVIKDWSEGVATDWRGPDQKSYGAVYPYGESRELSGDWNIPVIKQSGYPDLDVVLAQFWGLCRNLNIVIHAYTGKNYLIKFASKENTTLASPILHVKYNKLDSDAGTWRIERFKRLTFTDVLNPDNMASNTFTLVLGDIKPEEVGRWLAKDKVEVAYKDGVIFRGLVGKTSFDSETRELTIAGRDLTGLLLRRLISLHYAADWRGGSLALPAGLSGALTTLLFGTGVTLGAVGSYTYPGKTYEFMTVAEAIEQMAWDTLPMGKHYEWWVDLDTKLNFSDRRGSDKNIVIRNGVDEMGNSVISLIYVRDFEEQANRLTLMSKSGVKTTHWIDKTKIEEGKRKDLAYYAKEAWGGEDDIDGLTYLADYLEPSRTCTVKLPLRTDIGAGDGIKIIDERAGINETMRVMERTVTIDESGEFLTLQLASRAPELSSSKLIRQIFDLDRTA